MKAKFTAPEEKPDLGVGDELFDAVETPAEIPGIMVSKLKLTEDDLDSISDRFSKVQVRAEAQRTHAAAAQAQTLAEIDADVAARHFSTRFTELMSTALTTDDELNAAYELARIAKDIAEQKAEVRDKAQAATRKALAAYLDAYYAALKPEA